MSETPSAAPTHVRVDFRQVREALAAADQALTVFEYLLTSCVALQDENDRLRGALAHVKDAPLATDDAQRIAEEALSRV